MPYSIDRYSSNLFDPGTSFPLNIPDNTINSTSTSIRILGRGVSNYGEIVAESLVHLMENFAGLNPPTAPITGQLWWKQDPTNSNTAQKLYVWNGTTWKSVMGATPANTGPTGPSVGDLWYDLVNNTFNVWDGTSWQLVFTEIPGSLPTNPGASAPASPVEGMLWYNTTNDYLHTYNGSIWEALMKTSSDSGTTDDTFISYDIINGVDVIIIKINGIIVAIWSSQVIANAVLWDGTTPAGKPNIKAMYPGGLTAGVNFSNIANNGISGTGAKVFGDWTLAPGASMEATYADIAERYEADEKLAPGTLVSLGGTKEVTKTKGFGDTTVFGVVSTNPAFVLNHKEDKEFFPAIALAGRVPVLVEGPVAKGDRLVPGSKPGTAVKLDRSAFVDPFDAAMAVFGRALESKNEWDVGLVEVAVGAK